MDTATDVVRGLRRVTLPPKLSVEFLNAVQDQLTDTRSIAPPLARYHAMDILRLPKLAAVQA